MRASLCASYTRMKELKRGSFFCLLLIWSKAHDWWLQNLAVSFWNHSPSGPSNWRKQTYAQVSDTLAHIRLYNCVTPGQTAFAIICNCFILKHWQHPNTELWEQIFWHCFERSHGETKCSTMNREWLKQTHDAEHCGADGFDNEVVIRAQFLQVYIKVIWNNKQ